MLLALLGTLILVGLIHWLLTYNYGYWKKRGVPNPPPKPLVGNIGASVTMSKNFGLIFVDIYNKYKDCLYVGYYKIQQPGLVIRDPNLIKEILIKEFSHFHDNDVSVDPDIDPILGRNPFALKGQRWKFVRSQITNAITSGKIKNMYNLMTNVGKKLAEYLKKEPAATGKDGIELKELAAKYTTDVVAICAFGLEAKSFEEKDPEFRRMGRKIFVPTFFNSLKFSILFFMPSLSNILRLKFMPPDVQDWFISVVTQAVKYREKNNIVRNDYLDLLISLKNKSGEYVFTDTDVVAQAVTFYGDGFETSSITLSFALYEIAKNAEVQEKLKREVDTILSKHKNEITYEAMQEMNYLDMVVAESLRKYPPGLALLKKCTKTFTLPPPRGEGTGPNVVVEPGCSIVIPVFGIHHDPKYYPNPEEFIPERFTEEAKNARQKCTYLPFGDGPRMCLGNRFALTQIKAAVISVVQNFDLKMNPNTSPKLEFDEKYFMLAAKGGLWVNFYKRNK